MCRKIPIRYTSCRISIVVLLRVYSGMSMRRQLAITICLFLVATLAAPLLAVDTSSRLPACCRRDGSHHCMPGMSIGDSSGKTFSAIAPKCPSFPKATAGPVSHNWAYPPAGVSSTPLFAHADSGPQTEARSRISWSRSRQKRGPPVGLL